MADKFTRYPDAVKWIRSIGGHVGDAEPLSDGYDGVRAFGPNGISRQAGFPTGLTGRAHRKAYEEAACVACSLLHEAMSGRDGQ